MGTGFPIKIMLEQEHDPEKWEPVFRKDHAPKNLAKTREAGEKLAKPWLDALKKPAG